MGLSYTLPAPTPIVVAPGTDPGTRDLFGYDIAFREDFLLTPGGDYMRLGGKDNLKAAIYRRLITRPGEFRFRPSYGVGVGNYVKKNPTSAVLDQLKQRIKEQLLQDPRISGAEVDVQSTTIYTTPVLKVYVKVTAGGNPVSFDPFVFKEAA